MSKTTTKTPPTDNMQSALDAIEAAKQSARAAMEPMRQRVDELERERQALSERMADVRNAPLPPSDAAALFLDLIDIEAQDYAASISWDSLLRRLQKVSPNVTDERGHRERPTDLSMAIHHDIMATGMRGLNQKTGPALADFFMGHGMHMQNAQGRMYFLFGDIIKAKLKPIIEACAAQQVNHPHKDAPTLDQRRAELAELQARDDVLAAELEDLQGKLAELSAATA
ncbi:MAG: hypothetical protein RLZZ584_2481 [Pseudomonadota bacterium]|jgi:cell division protein FtsB